MKIETSTENGFFIRCKNKQAFKAFDRDVRASNCQSERFVSKPYPSDPINKSTPGFSCKEALVNNSMWSKQYFASFVKKALCVFSNAMLDNEEWKQWICEQLGGN